MKKTIIFIVGCLSFIAPSASAQIFSSPSFEVIQPVLYPAGYSTSSSFSLSSTLGQPSIGTSTAGVGGVRLLHSGFQYFPYVNAPTVVATAGTGQVALSWTGSIGVLGWSVSGYNVGRATASGGPYTGANVGLTLSDTETGLTGGTTYYFVVRALDAFGNIIATSSQVSSIPTSSTPPSSGGGGGGGGPYVPPAPLSGAVNIFGMGYPNALIHILKDSQSYRTIVADALGNFTDTIMLPAGDYRFGFIAEDSLGRYSNLVTTPLTLASSASSTISGIFLPPTIEADLISIEKGGSLGISGYAFPGGSVSLLVSLDPTLQTATHATELPVAPDGRYTFRFYTTDFEVGDYSGSGISTIKGQGLSSALSLPIHFNVHKLDAEDGVKAEGRACRVADLNDDTRVDLVDFSIATYWYKKALKEPFSSLEARCLNNDQKIDIYDFSLMAYYWTG